MSYTIVNHVGSELMTVKMRDKSFAIKWNKPEINAHSASVDKSALWHKRFGHFNYASLKNMSSMSFTQHLPAIDVVNEVCDVCQYEKQKRLPFLVNKAWRASEKLHLVHTDVCGPQKTQSLNGSRYFILFIDDFTRLCWVYFLKFKSEVAEMF